MYFGEYLLQENFIQERDLARALLIQKTDRVRLVHFALTSNSMGTMSSSVAFESREDFDPTPVSCTTC